MNTTTKAQRINKRQDAIWEKAKRANTGKPILDALIDASESLAEPDKTAHTPSPWNLHLAHDADVGFTWYVESEVQPGILAEGQNNEADARLIAAAPTMLEALKDVLAVVERATEHNVSNSIDTVACIAEAAIAKAATPKNNNTKGN